MHSPLGKSICVWLTLSIAVGGHLLASQPSSDSHETPSDSILLGSTATEELVPTDYASSEIAGDHVTPASGSTWDNVCVKCPSDYELILLPDQILYPSYLAGKREPRFAGIWQYDPELGWRWDAVLGGRAGILRYGTRDPHHPEGFQLDIEGAAFVRLNLEDEKDVDATDYRFGVPFTYRNGDWDYKFAYYHISSHVGDEFLVKNQDFIPNNYSRDSLVLGAAYRPLEDVRVYSEAGWAFFDSGPARPWEVQFGIEYATQRPTDIWGAPYAAVNARLREEVDFGGNVILQFGWQWVGANIRRFRMGFHFQNGDTDQVIFIPESEQQVGFGLYYDY